MKKKITVVCLLAASIAVTGCEFDKKTGGALLGGAGGAYIGSTIGKGSGRVAATGIGAVLGALLGGYVGQQLDEKDRLLAKDTADHTLSSGSTTDNGWQNPNTGRYGKSKVIATSSDGNCHTLLTTTYNRQGHEIGRETKNYCRDNHGNWFPISGNLR